MAVSITKLSLSLSLQCMCVYLKSCVLPGRRELWRICWVFRLLRNWSTVQIYFENFLKGEFYFWKLKVNISWFYNWLQTKSLFATSSTSTKIYKVNLNFPRLLQRKDWNRCQTWKVRFPELWSLWFIVDHPTQWKELRAKEEVVREGKKQDGTWYSSTQPIVYIGYIKKHFQNRICQTCKKRKSCLWPRKKHTKKA